MGSLGHTVPFFLFTQEGITGICDYKEVVKSVVLLYRKYQVLYLTGDPTWRHLDLDNLSALHLDPLQRPT